MVKKEKKRSEGVHGVKEKKPVAVPDDEEMPEELTIEYVNEKISVLRRGPPPPALLFEDFRDSFGLNGTGINPHKGKEQGDILLSDLTAVFGPQRGKSGFWIGDVKDSKVKSAIARLYPTVYQKPCVVKTKLIPKQFAIGIVADVVKGLDVDWAGFAYITNKNQRSAWQKKMKTFLEMKAELTGRTLTAILAEEEIDTLMQGEVLVNGKPGQLPNAGVGSGTPGQSSSWIEKRRRETTDLQRLAELELQAMKTDLQLLVKEKHLVDQKVEGVRVMVDTMNRTAEEFRAKIKNCEVEAEATKMQYGLEMFLSANAKSVLEYNSLLAIQDNQVADQEKLLRREMFLVGQQSLLAQQVLNLRSQKPGLSLHPHPMCLTTEIEQKEGDIVNVTNCVLCLSPFPYNDIIVCSCRHLYHPWCAMSWFSTSPKCVEETCSLVNPEWYKSFGFGEHPTVLEEKSEALGCEEQRNLALSERTAAAKRNGADIGSSQQPLFGQASVCTGTYSLEETSHAQLPPTASKEPDTPSHTLAVQVRPKNQSSEKKKSSEKVTSAAVVVVPEMPAKELFICTEATETEMVSAPGQPPSETMNDIEALVDPTDCTPGGKNVEHGSQGSSEHDQPMDEADNSVDEHLEPQSAMAVEGLQEFATKEDEVATLRATIAELQKQQGISKAVVRRPPAFEGVPTQILASTVKTKKVVDVVKGCSSSPTTRNKGKADKVRTRADGPSETVELIGSGSKKSKKKKVGAAAEEDNDDDDDHMTLDSVSQILPAKIKRPSKK